MTASAEKNREDRVRKQASRRGLRLVKNARRSPTSPGYGTFWIVDRAGAVVVDLPADPHIGEAWRARELGRNPSFRIGLPLDEIETWLANTPRETGDEVLLSTQTGLVVGMSQQQVEKFWSTIDVGHPLGCWLRKGTLTMKGYAYHWWTWDTRMTMQVHRIAYQLMKGPIPDGLQIDHLCRVRHCVNPDHLEAVTGSINQRRGYGAGHFQRSKTHCLYGHAFDEQNTYVDPRGRRNCRKCHTVEGRKVVIAAAELRRALR